MSSWNSGLAHVSLEMQLIKTAARHVDEGKDEMTVLVLHFLLHALPNFCSSGSQDPKTLILNTFTLVTATLTPPPTTALHLKYLPSLERQLPLITLAAQIPRLQSINPTYPGLCFFYPWGFLRPWYLSCNLEPDLAPVCDI